MSRSKYNLTFSGSGLLFPIHVGAYGALRSSKSFSEVAAVSGTSGGSLIAALTALDLGPRDMERLLKTFDFQTMIEWNPLAVFNMGYCNGRKVERALKRVFGENTLMGDTKIPLYVTASDVHAGKPIVFSSEKTPEVPIWLALRASLAIPLVFTPVRYKGMVLADGMLFNNVPFRVFENGLPTVGLHIISQKDDHYLDKWRYLPTYLLRIFNMIMMGLNRAHIDLSKLDTNTDLHIISAGEYTSLGDYPTDELIQFGFDSVQSKVRKKVV